MYKHFPSNLLKITASMLSEIKLKKKQPYLWIYLFFWVTIFKPLHRKMQCPRSSYSENLVRYKNNWLILCGVNAEIKCCV